MVLGSSFPSLGLAVPPHSHGPAELGSRVFWLLNTLKGLAAQREGGLRVGGGGIAWEPGRNAGVPVSGPGLPLTGNPHLAWRPPRIRVRGVGEGRQEVGADSLRPPRSQAPPVSTPSLTDTLSGVTPTPARWLPLMGGAVSSTEAGPVGGQGH